MNLRNQRRYSYEQIENIGLDYNLEQFVASIRIKRQQVIQVIFAAAEALEYVTFWADWNNDCNWQYVGTTT